MCVYIYNARFFAWFAFAAVLHWLSQKHNFDWPRWVSLLRVTGRAGGAGCACLRQDANAAVVVVTVEALAVQFGWSVMALVLFGSMVYSA